MNGGAVAGPSNLGVYTSGSGTWTDSIQETASFVGSYVQAWYVNGILVGQVAFTVYTVPVVAIANTSRPYLSPNFISGDSFTLYVVGAHA